MKFKLMAAPLLVLLWAPATLAQESYPRPRIISVTGTAEVTVVPDEAILRLGVESRDKELATAKSHHDERIRSLMTLTRDNGVEAKYIQTGMLRMGPEYSEDKKKLIGYEVSQQINIILKDLSKYEALMTKLLETGVNRVYGVEFLVAEPQKYRAEVRLKTIRAAREKATAMAAELGQKIGKRWEISDESYSGGAPANTSTNYYGYDSAYHLADATIAPGEETISASVRVSFQLE